MKLTIALGLLLLIGCTKPKITPPAPVAADIIPETKPPVKPADTSADVTFTQLSRILVRAYYCGKIRQAAIIAKSENDWNDDDQAEFERLQTEVGCYGVDALMDLSRQVNSEKQDF